MDFGTPQFKTTFKYTIRVSEENDNVPTLSKSLYEVWVEENNVVVGTFLWSVLANELDLVHNPEITYRLINENRAQNSLHQSVSVNSVSGSVCSALAFIFELTKAIDVQIQASDGGYPVLSNTTLDTSYGPKWQHTSDNIPSFVNGAAFAFLATDVSTDMRVLRIKAQDADEGLNAELTFLILEEANKLFTVNEQTGDLYLRNTPSYHSDKTFYVEVGVKDKGVPPLMTRLKVNVISAQEH